MAASAREHSSSVSFQRGAMTAPICTSILKIPPIVSVQVKNALGPIYNPLLDLDSLADKEDQWLGVTVKSQGEGGMVEKFFWSFMGTLHFTIIIRLRDGLCPSVRSQGHRLPLGKRNLLLIVAVSRLQSHLRTMP